MKINYLLLLVLILSPLILTEKTFKIPNVIERQDVDYCDLLNKALMFYKYNRAGRLPDNDVPWRGNSVLKDASPGSQPDSNGDGDLSKGYFDAGDHVKFAFPMAGSMTILGWSYLEYTSAIQNCNAEKVYLEDLRWGYDWLMAAHIAPTQFCAQVGNAEIDHAYWGPPELLYQVIPNRPTYMINETSPGTELAMEVAAALSTCALIFKDSDPNYAQQCLSHAIQMHEFGDNYRGIYSDSVPDAQGFYKSWSGYHDDLVWGSIWVYKATGDKNYLIKAVDYYNQYGVGQMSSQNSHDWDLKSPGATLLLTQLFPGNETFINDFENYANWWLPGSGVQYTPGGLAWIRPWASARYSMTQSFLMSIYGGNKYTSFTRSQMSYVIGNNPNKQSFVVGYGPNHPINPHHRGSHHSLTFNINSPVNNTYSILGSLVGGPDQNDGYTDDRTDYVRNEVACDYQAGFIGTICYHASQN